MTKLGQTLVTTYTGSGSFSTGTDINYGNVTISQNGMYLVTITALAYTSSAFITQQSMWVEIGNGVFYGYISSNPNTTTSNTIAMSTSFTIFVESVTTLVLKLNFSFSSGTITSTGNSYAMVFTRLA